MRKIVVLCLAALTGAPALASAAPHDAGAKSLGIFDDWTAATHVEAGQTTCYAFTRLSSSSANAPHGRGTVVLTVTERPNGRDSVAISAGFTYPPGAEVSMEVEHTTVEFYTLQRSAFASKGGAAVAALHGGRNAIIHSSAPHGGAISDTFSLRGFAQAYQAITKACPTP